ncbi:hypothetical protein CBR_g34765 [Chara braunii]|uniref:Sacsin/Nov domain-containing protein n=1 Tax=Chara braunii TaxID=69332 RepID=A0A388LJ93_CHABU|nr:hypothetical protein CBR_g34765 [Chara braunii]|eukprot:GBG82389.1 hypothetical protein CBR_g34765 [Chara braunii]
MKKKNKKKMGSTEVSRHKLSIFEWTEDTKEHIELIRKAKFRVGVPKIMDGGASDALAHSLLTDLHGACAHLSEMLYQKDTHFILELIQNAEDNTYPDDERPSLMFVLGEGDPTVEGGAEVDHQSPRTINNNSMCQLTLAVYNNELGFQRENVEALCGIAKSTKKNKEFGYIGEKGIGFKSVFVVCKRPCILSGGYRFGFDESPDLDAGIGYIVPTWLDENTANASQLRKFYLQDAFRTAILLPLKPEKGKHVWNQLWEIAPETMLFLRKLQLLVIYDLVNGSFTAFDRKLDKKTGVVELKRNTVATKDSVRYWLYQAVFDVPSQIVEEKRVGITKWTIFVAFPFCKSGNTGEDAHDVFAFLPTEVRSGWPFLINADFLLIASREAILFDRPWNVGLLQCMPIAFVEGYLDLQRRERSCVSTLASKQYDVLRFVPLHTVSKGLESVRKQMIACLRSHEVIPVSKLFKEGENAAAGASRVSPSAFGRSSRSSSSGTPSLTSGRNSAPLENAGTADMGGSMQKGRGENLGANTADEVFAWCNPKYARMADPIFVEFLWRVKNAGYPIPFWFGTRKERGGRSSAPSTSGKEGGLKWRMYLVDEDAQQRYYFQLVELGVQSMSKKCYWDCVGLGDWCENLSDGLYVELLAVFANGQFSGKEDMAQNGVKLLRVDGEEKLSESTSERPVYLPPVERDDWLTTCIEQLQTVAPVRLFSKRVYKTLCCSSSGLSIVGMLQKFLNVKRLTAESYASQVFQASLQLADPEKVLLVTDFFRNALERYALPVPTTITRLSMIPVLEENGRIILRGAMHWRQGSGLVPTPVNSMPVLMPQSISRWPALLAGETSWEGKVIKLSKAYLRNSAPQFHGSGGQQVHHELQDLRSKREDFIKRYLRAVDLFSLEPSSDAGLQILYRSPPEGLPAKKAKILIEWLGYLVVKYGLTCGISRGSLKVIVFLRFGRPSTSVPGCQHHVGAGDLLRRGFLPNESARWCEPSDCVWEDEDGLFADSLPVLKGVYANEMQQWFKQIGVHAQPTVDHCLQIWLDRTQHHRAREDASYVDTNFAGKVWGLIARSANEAQKSKVWAVFLKTAMLPVAVRAGESDDGCDGSAGGRQVNKQTSSAAAAAAAGRSRLRLGKPSRLFIPDDLLLEKVFVDCDPTLPLVWLPDTANPQELHMLFHLCTAMGAHLLSEASTTKVFRKGKSLPLPLPSNLHVELQTGHSAPEPVLGDPLFTAVLGCWYLPGVMDQYDREEYRTVARNGFAERIAELAQAVSGGVLPSHHKDLVKKCAEFLRSFLLPRLLTMEAVEYLLRQNNIRLSKVDRQFIQDAKVSPTINQKDTQMDENTGAANGNASDEEGMMADGHGDGDVVVNAITIPLPLSAAGNSGAEYYSDASAAEPKTVQETIIEVMEGELNPMASPSTIREMEQGQWNAGHRGRHSGSTQSSGCPMESVAVPSAGVRGEKKTPQSGAQVKTRDELATSRADAIMEVATSQEEGAPSAPVVVESVRRRKYANLRGVYDFPRRVLLLLPLLSQDFYNFAAIAATLAPGFGSAPCCTAEHDRPVAAEFAQGTRKWKDRCCLFNCAPSPVQSSYGIGAVIVKIK